MHFKPIGTLTFGILLSALPLRAQPTPPPPPPPPPYYPYTGSVNTAVNNVVADVSLPYAFNFNNVGVVGDLGGIWQNNFLGAELSYYDAQPDHHDGYFFGGYGPHGYNEDITTANVAYRYYVPLPMPGYGPSGANMAFYIGAAAGAGWVNVHTGYFYPGYNCGPNYYDSGSTRFDANGVAGFQWNFGRFVGFKVGYRYIWLDDSHLFYTNKRLSSSAAEAGLAFRF